jgi:hypothetical protein
MTVRFHKPQRRAPHSRKLPTQPPAPSRQRMWDWTPEREVVEGPSGNLLTDVLARCQAMYAPTTPSEGEAE